MKKLLFIFALLLLWAPAAQAQTFQEGERAEILATYEGGDYLVSFTIPKVKGRVVALQAGEGQESWTAQYKNGAGFSAGSIAEVLPGATARKALRAWGEDMDNRLRQSGRTGQGLRYAARGGSKDKERWDMVAVSPTVKGKDFFGEEGFAGYKIPVGVLGYKASRRMLQTLTITYPIQALPEG